MQKNALTLTLTTGVAGIFGAFLRWLQNMNAFEEDTGLLIPGRASTTAMVIYIILAAVLFALVAFFWTKRVGKSTDQAEALVAHTPIPPVLTKVLGGITLVCCALVLIRAGQARFPLLDRAFAICGVLAAMSTALLFVKNSMTAKNRGAEFIVLVLFTCLWLVSSYKTNSENPVIWQFAIEILAIAALIMAWYGLAAYCYGRAKPETALLFIQLGAFLSITTLSDTRTAPLQLLFAAQAALMLMWEFVIVENMWDGRS